MTDDSTTTGPQLTPAAEQEFTDALLNTCGAIFARPDAAATLAGFLDGEVFLVLTRDRLFVREVPPEKPENPAPKTDTPDTDGMPGMYL